MFSPKVHSNIYFFCLVMLAAAIPLSQSIMSFAQLFLFLNWIAEGDLKNKFNKFFNNKIAVILSSLYLLHILGLLNTSDFDYALKDLRVKFPLLFLPLIISSSSQISKIEFRRILYFFITSVFAGSVISLFIIFYKNPPDVRSAFIFISHIRFSLCICIAIFSAIYIMLERRMERSKLSVIDFILLCSIAYFIFCFVIFQSATGLAIISALYFIFSIIFIIKPSLFALYFADGNDRLQHQRNKIIYFRLGILLLNISIVFIAGFFFFRILNDVNKINKVDFKTLAQYTIMGNKYENDTINLYTENGNYYGIYYCEKELSDSWNKRSKLDFYGRDLKGQFLKETLRRYITSKGLRKDAEGLNKLSENDITAIERGVANYYYITKPPLYSRLHQLIWEYKLLKEDDFINSHSFAQRFEYWKASVGIIKDNFWIGVGTGDMNLAFKDQYVKMKSSLDLNNRWRSHNQFLSMFVAFGIIGFLWFIITLFYPLYSYLKSSKSANSNFSFKASTFLYLCFFLTIVISMLTEDTIESQAGLTLYAFFNSFLLFETEKRDAVS